MGALWDGVIAGVRKLRKGSTTTTSSSAAGDVPSSNRSLERELRGWQIFMILISGIIGVTIFATNGEFLRTAGPAGLLTAIAFVGVTAICVMEGLGEMVVIWPVSNAMFEYVHIFVDQELAFVVAIAYWYSWASVIATMFVVAANFTTYWNLPTVWQTLAFYILGPFVVLVINGLGVKWYGWVEGIVGTLKLLFVVGGAIFLFAVGARHGSNYINAGYNVDTAVARNPTSAVVLTIPYLTYGFLGVEIVSVTAFEAKKPRHSLRQSSRWISWVITLLFVLCGLGEGLNVAWDNDRLPEMTSGRPRPTARDTNAVTAPKESFSILVLAANLAGHQRFAGFLNACLVISCLSAANTALYVASRTLYGLCRELTEDSGPNQSRPKRWAAYLGALDPRTRVPVRALIVSTLAFFWLPFLHLRNGYSVQSLLEVMSTIGSVGCVLVWLSQCVAYIRYHRWFRTHRKELDALIKQGDPNYRRYNRENPNTKERYYSIASPIQPFPAYLGAVLCFLIVFVFSSATLWKNQATVRKVAVAYAGPIACIIFWVVLKLLRYRRERKVVLWTDLGWNPSSFHRIIHHFEGLMYLRDEDEDLVPLRRMGTAQLLGEDNRPNNNTTPAQDGLARDGTTIEERTGESVIGAGSNPTTEGLDTQYNTPAATLSPEDLQGLR